MTLDNGRRFDRSSRLTLEFVLLMIIASATVSVLRLMQVGDGCVLDAGAVNARVFATCLGDWSTPLRPGDELVGIAGVATRDSWTGRPKHAPPGWVDGGTAQYSVRRAGQTLELLVPLHRLHTEGTMRAFAYGLRRQGPDWNTLVFLGVLVIFALAPRARAAQLLLAGIGGLTAVTMLLWPSTGVGADFVSAPLWYISSFLDGVWWWWFIPTVIVVVLSFPRRVWPLTRYPRLGLGLIYGFPLAATAIGFMTANEIPFVIALGLGALVAVVSLVVVTAQTFLRVHDPVIRAQTAWLAPGRAAGLMFWPLFFVLALLVPGLLPALDRLPRWADFALTAPVTLAFPVCLGIAITRYRLFEIDIIIRRTLIYGALTAVLALVYFASVVVLQQLLTPIFGPRNDIAVVASTLAIAGLFQPLRRRIQATIDRRFFRRKYDAARTLAGFTGRLRDEVEMDALTSDLLAVVDQTLQPAHVSLWLRQGTLGPGKR